VMDHFKEQDFEVTETNIPAGGGAGEHPQGRNLQGHNRHEDGA
jgi:hypothetical protein